MKRFGLFFAAALTLLTINSTGIAQSISDLPQSLSNRENRRTEIQ